MTVDEQDAVNEAHDGLKEMLRLIDLVAENLGPDPRHMALLGICRLGGHIADGLRPYVKDEE